ncbi:MAG: threonine aldolase family protein, partial [Candidatus Binataceae bacterium]
VMPSGSKILERGLQPLMIDLSSDTVTKPTQPMLAAMMVAPVGDDQRQEDPTVNALQDKIARLLGKEAALFLPSATMANEIALKVHTQPGDEAIVERSCHFVTSEAGGPAFLSGVMLHMIEGTRGIFTPQQVEAGIRRSDMHCPPTRVVCVEQTSNRGGGSVWPLDALRGVAEIASKHKLGTHMDGSRLMNAVVASGIPAHEHARGYDTVTFCLTKGLGCPIGALLAGNRDLIHQARRYKHLFGGAMRQAGIVAAAGLYALDHNVERLRDDHANAALLAKRIAGIRNIRIDADHVETNLVYFDVAPTGLSGQKFVTRLMAQGVRVMSSAGPTLIRAVTHLDLSRDDAEEAARIIAEVTEAASDRSRSAPPPVGAGTGHDLAIE